MAVRLGTLGADTVKGTQNADIITALAGNDIIFGMAGGDTIDAGDGDDIVYANTRSSWSDDALDTVLGGAGNDHIYGGYGDILNGGFGFDRLSLDLSNADHGIAIDFRPMTLAGVGELVTIKVDQTQLSGFEAVTDVRGSAFADRIFTENQDRIAVSVDAGAGNDLVRAATGDDHLLGGDGSDRLLGRAGHDTISGGEGNDRLFGGRSGDMLTGGAGADLFFFNDRDAPAGRARADVITDFSHADGDTISLRAIDAIAGGDDDRFTFIGADRFSGTAGELRFAVVGDATFISGDTDGDSHADFSIQLDGQVALVGGDFQL